MQVSEANMDHIRRNVLTRGRSFDLSVYTENEQTSTDEILNAFPAVTVRKVRTSRNTMWKEITVLQIGINEPDAHLITHRKVIDEVNAEGLHA